MEKQVRTRSVLVVDSQSSKDEEKDALQKMVMCARPGSYLNSLFTAEMVNWVERQINDDGCCDLFGALQDEYKRSGEKMSEIGKLDGQVQNNRYVVEQKDKRIAYLEELLREAKRDAGEKAEAASKRNVSLCDEVWKINALRADAGRLAEGLQAQVTALKVRMYDLEHPITALEVGLERLDSERDAELERRLDADQARDRQWEVDAGGSPLDAE